MCSHRWLGVGRRLGDGSAVEHPCDGYRLLSGADETSAALVPSRMDRLEEPVCGDQLLWEMKALQQCTAAWTMLQAAQAWIVQSESLLLDLKMTISAMETRENPWAYHTECKGLSSRWHAMREAISKMPEPEVPEDEVGATQIDSPTDEVATTQLDSPTEEPEIKIGPNVKLEPGTKGVKLKIEPGIELEKPTIEPEIKIEPKAESELKTGKGKGKGKTKKKGTPRTDDIGGKRGFFFRAER